MPAFAQTIVAWNQGFAGIIAAESWFNTLMDAEDMLSDIVEYFCAGTGAAAFDPYEFHELGDIVFVHTWNTVLGGDLQFGMDRQGFFLQMRISHAENIPRMPDDFWRQWLSLADLGKFSFEESEGLRTNVEAEHPSLFGVQPDNLFRLMRNFIAYEMQHGETIDLGSLRLEWPFDLWPVNDVITKGAIAVSAITALNHRLAQAS